jgi:ribonuclease Z
MDLSVLFLGTAGSMPTVQRAPASLLARRGGERILIDCGEGTQRQLLRSVGLPDIEHVFLTHYHADHFLGLPGMLKTFSLRGRERPLTVHGPPGLQAVLSALKPVVGRTTFELRVVELEPNAEVERDGYRIATFAVDHGVRAQGYALIENERPGHFDEVRARELGVAPGPSFGLLQRGEAVTGADGQVLPEQVLGDPRRGRKIVITGDTAPCDMTKHVAHEADLLIHEASFMQEDVDRAAETRHSTAKQAAELAKEANVRLLALTHVSPRYSGAEIRDEARKVFERTLVPADFDRVELPFPERGDPEHVRTQELGTRD